MCITRLTLNPIHEQQASNNTILKYGIVVNVSPGTLEIRQFILKKKTLGTCLVIWLRKDYSADSKSGVQLFLVVLDRGLLTCIWGLKPPISESLSDLPPKWQAGAQCTTMLRGSKIFGKQCAPTCLLPQENSSHLNRCLDEEQSKLFPKPIAQLL